MIDLEFKRKIIKCTLLATLFIIHSMNYSYSCSPIYQSYEEILIERYKKSENIITVRVIDIEKNIHEINDFIRIDGLLEKLHSKYYASKEYINAINNYLKEGFENSDVFDKYISRKEKLEREIKIIENSISHNNKNPKLVSIKNHPLGTKIKEIYRGPVVLHLEVIKSHKGGMGVGSTLYLEAKERSTQYCFLPRSELLYRANLDEIILLYLDKNKNYHGVLHENMKDIDDAIAIGKDNDKFFYYFIILLVTLLLLIFFKKTKMV